MEYATIIDVKADEVGKKGDCERDKRLGNALDKAIEATELAFKMLTRLIKDTGLETEPLVFENETRYCYYRTLKFDALEISDAIYDSLGANDRKRDDRDLAEFEATLIAKDSYSDRVKALAVLTYGKVLIGEYEPSQFVTIKASA